MVSGLLYLCFSYLLAAIPFGLVISTLYGGDVDIRSAGSGNIGATNVARVYGWSLAIPVMALDIGKGFVPTVMARVIWPDAWLVWPVTVALVAFLGHCYSVFLEFRGGKGVATGAGGMLAIAPIPTLIAFAVWMAVLRGFGRSSVASLCAATALMIGVGVLRPEVLFGAALLLLGIFITHVPNIQRLIRGEEKHVIRPVQWGRKAERPKGDRILDAGPTGSSTTKAPMWKEQDVDPLDEITGAREIPWAEE